MKPESFVAGLAAVLLAVPAPASAIEILTQSLPSGTAGEPFDATLFATGGELARYVWDVQGLPAGLTLENGPLATIGGVPAEVGTFPLSISVTDGSTRASARGELKIDYSTYLQGRFLDALLQGEDYQEQLETRGGTAPVIFTRVDGELPEGLSLADDGRLAGTVNLGARPGEYAFTVEARDGASHIGRAAFGLSVQERVRSLEGGLLGSVQRGATFHAELEYLGGKPPVSFSRVDGDLPGGLSLAADGTIDGKVVGGARVGDHTFTVEARDAAQYTGRGDFVIHVLGNAMPGTGAPSSSAGGCSAGGGAGWPAVLAGIALFWMSARR